MVICAIIGCSKRSGRDCDVSFFRIPCVDLKRKLKLEEIILKRQQVWLNRIHRGDMDEVKIKNSRICSLHFVSGKPSSHDDIDNPDWAPSLHLGHNMGQNMDSASERYHRRLQRSRNKISGTKRSSEDAQLDISDDIREGTEPDALDDTMSTEDAEVTMSTEDTEIVTNDFDSVSFEIIKLNVECSTEMSLKDIDELEKIKKDHYYISQEYIKIKTELSSLIFNYETFNDDSKVNFYTGLSNTKLLRIVFNFVSGSVKEYNNNNLSKFSEFLLFLMRLRLNLLTQDLGYRFNISQSSVSRIFMKWLCVMHTYLKKAIVWPEREALIQTMPQSFKVEFKGCVAVILDCFEIILNRPSSLKARALTWSNYKQRNTVKYLIGITPQGVICFTSLGWGDRASDKHISENCGLLNFLLPGDLLLADRGFNNLNCVGFYSAKLIVPASARGKKQLSPLEVEETRKIASLRIHVERVIGQLRKKFRILKGTLTSEMCLKNSDDDITQIDKIVEVCCALTNLCPSVVPFS